MTLNQLLREVCSLGFEDTGELDEGFVFAANRALRIVHSHIAAEKRVGIPVNAPEISQYLESYTYTPTKPLIIHLTEKAYSFKYSGTGTYTLKDPSGVRTVSFSSKNGTEKGFFNGECDILFSGSLSYLIMDFTAFYEKTSDEREKIPVYAGFNEISLSEYIPDFSFATAPPEDKNGNVIEGGVIGGERLSLPFRWSGEVFIRYKSAPAPLSLSYADAKIDIPSYAEHLLPLLTASYVWLDDDFEKADYYAALYRSELNAILFNAPRGINSKFKDVLGWA